MIFSWSRDTILQEESILLFAIIVKVSLKSQRVFFFFHITVSIISQQSRTQFSVQALYCWPFQRTAIRTQTIFLNKNNRFDAGFMYNLPSLMDAFFSGAIRNSVAISKTFPWKAIIYSRRKYFFHMQTSVGFTAGRILCRRYITQTQDYLL